MNKKMKIAAVTATALLAVTPLVTTSTAHAVSVDPISANNKQHVTMADFKNAFFGKINIVDQSNPSEAPVTNPVDVAKALDNVAIYQGKKDITKVTNATVLQAGDYTATYLTAIPGFKASKQNRTFAMETTNGAVIGEAYLPARATTAMGLVHFKVRIDNTGLGQPTYLGSTSSELPRKTKKRAKKSSRKSKRRTKKTRKSRKNKKNKKSSKHAAKKS